MAIAVADTSFLLSLFGNDATPRQRRAGRASRNCRSPLAPAPFLRVRASTAKNPKESLVRLRPEVVEAIRSILQPNAKPSDKVFARGVVRVRTMRKDLEAAKIPFEDAHDRRVDLHAMRDTFGTHLAAAGVAPFVLKELMRHSTVQQSEKYYIAADQLPVAAAMAALPKFAMPDHNSTIQTRITG